MRFVSCFVVFFIAATIIFVLLFACNKDRDHSAWKIEC
jgi:hypothetical protein